MPASRTPLLRLLAALLGLALLAGACSDDEPEDEGGTSVEEGAPRPVGLADLPNPCELLTPAALQEHFGSPFAAGELVEQTTTGSRQCTWTNTDVPPVKTFTLIVANDGSLEEAFGRDATEYFTLTRQAFATSQSIDEPDLGLGDGSYLAGTYLYVLDGTETYTFSTVLGDSPEAIAGLKALAAEVVGR